MYVEKARGRETNRYVYMCMCADMCTCARVRVHVHVCVNLCIGMQVSPSVVVSECMYVVSILTYIDKYVLTCLIYMNTPCRHYTYV